MIWVIIIGAIVSNGYLFRQMMTARNAFAAVDVYRGWLVEKLSAEWGVSSRTVFMEFCAQVLTDGTIPGPRTLIQAHRDYSAEDEKAELGEKVSV